MVGSRGRFSSGPEINAPGWLRAHAQVREGFTARADLLVDARGDPLFQLLAWFGGYRQEDRFWQETLQNVSRRFGGTGEVRTQSKLTSRRFNWRAAGNIVHNAGIHTTIHRVARLFRRRSMDAGG